MKLCAIVLDYRGASKTEACLRSLAGQGVDTVIVVDNSDSHDASAALANAVERLKSAGIAQRLHVLRPDTNLGFARGVNFAISHPASGHCDSILLVNNDAIMSPGALQPMVAALSAGEAEIVAPMIVDDLDKPQPHLWYQRFFGLLTEHRLPGSYFYLSGCCMLFRRNLIPSGKLFDEDFFMYGEDTLLGWRMLQEGKRTRQIKDASVRHSGQNANRTSNLFYEYHVTRAHILLAKKTARIPAEKLILVCTKTAGLVLRALTRCIRYRSLTPAKALLLAWRPLAIRKA